MARRSSLPSWLLTLLLCLSMLSPPIALGQGTPNSYRGFMFDARVYDNPARLEIAIYPVSENTYAPMLNYSLSYVEKIDFMRHVSEYGEVLASNYSKTVTRTSLEPQNSGNVINGYTRLHMDLGVGVLEIKYIDPRDNSVYKYVNLVAVPRSNPLERLSGSSTEYYFNATFYGEFVQGASIDYIRSNIDLFLGTEIFYIVPFFIPDLEGFLGVGIKNVNVWLEGGAYRASFTLTIDKDSYLPIPISRMAEDNVVCQPEAQNYRCRWSHHEAAYYVVPNHMLDQIFTLYDELRRQVIGAGGTYSAPASASPLQQNLSLLMGIIYPSRSYPSLVLALIDAVRSDAVSSVSIVYSYVTERVPDHMTQVEVLLPSTIDHKDLLRIAGSVLLGMAGYRFGEALNTLASFRGDIPWGYEFVDIYNASLSIPLLDSSLKAYCEDLQSRGSAILTGDSCIFMQRYYIPDIVILLADYLYPQRRGGAGAAAIPTLETSIVAPATETSAQTQQAGLPIGLAYILIIVIIFAPTIIYMAMRRRTSSGESLG